eukprot:CAMPEP_0118884900 /NCGR_PEP_ID=MMETSP1163-20130328/23592_1 /TAXON_ID=124430 /ORGANISM="Phaeomonas parva, Strain CCMP2877" /LENGTH=57 /DNA_ID=CAMNT_0006822813 /DNA_START=304 /DNA_END=473 /DNA_ORIENTATION=-
MKDAPDSPRRFMMDAWSTSLRLEAVRACSAARLEMPWIANATLRRGCARALCCSTPR